MTLELIPITHLALPIPPAMSDLAWQQAQAYPSMEARWNFYLNQIASQSITADLAEDFPQIRISPQTNTWQFFNGSVLELNTKRIILVPSKAIDHSELVIPQEWVDIPAWAGDYFLAVQIDPDDQILHCWGYTTHQMMKSQARYDASTRTYNLDAHHLIADVSGLWVIQQLNPSEVTQTAITPLNAVATTQAENLLQRLVAASNPRLEIPFELWGALVSDHNWRQRFVALRQGATSLQTNLTTATNRLSGWLQNVFTTGWQAVEDFMGEDGELAFRQTATPNSVMRRVKVLQLPGTASNENRVLLLLISVEPEADERLGIQVQLRSNSSTATLPADLTLALLASDDEVLRSVVTRDQDNAIQLPRFRLNSGTEFKIQVQLGTTTLIESFLV
jgi:Protein of unknown function (DUF1822)